MDFPQLPTTSTVTIPGFGFFALHWNSRDEVSAKGLLRKLLRKDRDDTYIQVFLNLGPEIVAASILC